VRRANALCPGCGALERHRLLWLYLERKSDVLTAALRLLHVAPEPWLSQRLRRLPRVEHVSIDLESRQVMAVMDATRLALRDGCFDVVLCLHVLEHIPDDRVAMRELRRVLKPGGWGILQSPFDPERAETFEDGTVTSPRERERVFGQKDHVRIYGRDYVVRLRTAGFEVEECELARELSPEDAERYGILRDETLMVCRRPVTR
jgi:SAM-dependent methyltransferase